MVSEYTYSKNDLLRNPLSYQKTPFEGIDFLRAFKKSRLDVLEREDFYDFKLENFLNNFKNSRRPNSVKFKLFDLLSYFLSQSEFKSKKNLVDKMLKKFEVKKKLFTEYDLDFKEVSNDFQNLKNYMLFGIICIIYYEKYSSLKYLNVHLKINDILCSQIDKIIDNDRNLFCFVLKKELEYIDELCRKKGIIL